MRKLPISRRTVLRGTALAAGSGLVLGPRLAFGQVTSGRPEVPYGVQVGDVDGHRAILWSKADRPARMNVTWATTESMANSHEVPWISAVEDTDFTGKIDLAGLPADQTIFYEVSFVDLGDLKTSSAPVKGSFRTPPREKRNIRFVWSGDTAGQGWGINPDLGGMTIYEQMRLTEPDFFIHSGDTIYADVPIEAEVALPDGTVWKNITTKAKSKVAETLDDFRGNYAYNLLDDNIRRMNLEVPLITQWDDHEVTNNWYWSKRMEGDERYRERSVALLASRSLRAFHEYMPTRVRPTDPHRLYGSFKYGPSLEVFRIDLRSYRADNTDAQPTELSDATRILGRRQMAWLRNALKVSKATWKVIASDMPLGLIVYDDFRAQTGAEAVALRDGPPAGRELEIAQLLAFIEAEDIGNVVWVTADVHYTAAHAYDPSRARFTAFKPFWEFVSGPLNAGTFGPGTLDDTFGPEAVFVKAPPEGQFNLPPSDGLQFFGQVDIDGDTEVMTVTLKDASGASLFSKQLEPER